MAWKSLSTSFRGLLVLLLTVQFSNGVPFPAAQPAAKIASTLSEINKTVPDYVTRYAPLVRLHSDDPFRPSDILRHIRHTKPLLHLEPIIGLPELDLDNLALLNEKLDSGSVALTSNDDVSSLPVWIFGEEPDKLGRQQNASSCVVILVKSGKGSQDFDVFYFYFYSYDRGPNITQILPPMNSLVEDTQAGMHFGDHVGDWEHNMIRFRDGKPTGIYYSQHADGSAYDWDDTALTVDGQRPLVYSAYGSHANWASPGQHVHDEVLLDYCDAGQLWDPIYSAYFYRLDPINFTLTRIFTSETPMRSNFTSFLYYSGLWGDSQYPDHHPLQKTVPYFGLKRFVSGPTGPLDKQLVRKGLFPDHRDKKTWLQKGVHIFMSLYPCCLRGWRAWLSGTVFVGILVSIVLGITYSMKWYRSRAKGYRKVDTGADIPLDALDYRDDIAVHHVENDQT